MSATSHLELAAARRPGRDRALAMIDDALAALPRMRRPDGIFCWERVLSEEGLRGTSLRYSLMALLGLLRAQANGYTPSVDPAELYARLWDEIDSSELAPGDYGLYLWVEARIGGDRGPELLDRLERSLAAGGGLGARAGMEIGWIVTGLAEACSTGVRAEAALRRAVDQLLGPNCGESGLFNHFGDGGLRRRFPNFATQIYAVLALSRVALHGLDDRALPAATRAADLLLAAQLPDGGFPWIYDTRTGRAVERYEVYSVHQDAMAPMGFLELAQVSGDNRYEEAAVRGLAWIDGHNQLRADMTRAADGLVLRSIRRKAPFDRLALWANTAAALAFGRSFLGEGRQVELNPTDRPYHFGWVLEAWCGREQVLA